MKYNTYLTVQKGQTVRLMNATPFADFDGNAIDPDVVSIGFQVAGEEDQTYVFHYTNGDTPPDPDNKIQRASTGMYYADFNTNNYPAGVWECSIAGWPESGLDETESASRFNWQILVEDEPFSLM